VASNSCHDSCIVQERGDVAQLVERRLCKPEVAGSRPVVSTPFAAKRRVPHAGCVRRLVLAITAVLLVIAAQPALAGPAARAPAYSASVEPIGPALRQRMVGVSWRPGCPVPIRSLALVNIMFWGFDRAPHHGRIIVRKGWGWRIAGVFRTLYVKRFPIRSVRLIEAYNGSDRASMAADNTSGFNCRWRAGVCCQWSQHAYGRAIDLNPVENPFIYNGGVSPPAGRAYLDRSHNRRGMVMRRGVVWRAFHRIGWSWGGDWSGEKDYQHFSVTGT
jgi:D-alanyl-D-alanine carboxypeptidase